MSDDGWKTMRVPTEAWEQAQEQRKAAGRTWGEQIVRPDGDTAAADVQDFPTDAVKKALRDVLRDELPETA